MADCKIMDVATSADSSSDSSGTASTATGHYARQLTPAELERLRRQNSRPMTAFKKEKLEKEAMKNWDRFYHRNQTRFFKDRHWTQEEFQRLCSDLDWGAPMTLLEAGCGVGNFLLPFVDAFANITHAYGCDFSQRAIDLLKERDSYDPARCTVFACDLTLEDNSNSLLSYVDPCSIDLCTLIFVLSAVNEAKMTAVVSNLSKVMKPGGSVIVRDYGLYDYAMIRFEPGQKLSQNAYVRQDGTRTYYFSEEEMKKLFTDDFDVVSCEYVCRETVNRKEHIRVPRIFVQGRFLKR